MNFDKWRHYLRARWFGILRKHDNATREYQLALRFDPGFRKAANALAYHCAQSGRDAEAIRYFQDVLRMESRDADTHFNLGFVLARNGQHRGAIESFRAAVGLNAVHDRAWYGMGLAHAILGEHREAMNSFDEAARLQPMGAPVWYQLGMACHHAHEPERVRKVIRHLNRFDPRMARRLILETGSTDLAYLVKDLVV